MIAATVKVPMPIPYRDNAEVMQTAARLLHNTRRMGGSRYRGLASLDHTQEVAKNLALSYLRLGTQGGFEYALLYARVEEFFGAWSYRLSMAESAVTYRAFVREVRA